jgi:hypothetical protein
MIRFIYLVFLFVSVYFNGVFCDSYYVKNGGTDNTGCTTYDNAYSNIIFVLTNVMNGKGVNHTVYVDGGTYVYNTGFSSSSSGFNNFIVNHTVYVATSHVSSSDDIITYPVVNVTTSTSSDYFIWFLMLIFLFVSLYFSLIILLDIHFD